VPSIVSGMKQRNSSRFAAAGIGLLTCRSVQAEQGHLIRFDEPAKRWVEALPVGNEHLGAMVFGGTTVERIQLKT